MAAMSIFARHGVTQEVTGAAGLLPSDHVISVDLLLGMVMMVMTPDHTREFFTSRTFAPEDLGGGYGGQRLRKMAT